MCDAHYALSDGQDGKAGGTRHLNLLRDFSEQNRRVHRKQAQSSQIYAPKVQQTPTRFQTQFRAALPFPPTLQTQLNTFGIPRKRLKQS